ncbi:hypothetical protein HYQ80_004082 [Salmonella enterica]|nr:hypothetical protein [Salmonella enterica]ECL6067769.1 hypothetical protein [Salmonella enterica]ECP1354582.1 hypothetical protein [Salmonella enterica]EEB3186284.1 hypothetical protein [Salmonella enterica]EFR0683394.1 hypothetical protein [Salmonella enterica]
MLNNQQYNKYVLQSGNVSEIHFNLLMEISTIRSEKIKKALHDYFIRGDSRINACVRHNVSQGNLSLKIREIQILSRKVYALNIYYT